MADVKEFGYYIKGSRIAIVQKDIDATIIDSTYKPPTRAEWRSPTGDIDNGLQLEYAIIPKSTTGREITDESDDIDIPRALGEAIVSYVKYKSFEEMGKMDMAMWWLKQYERLVSESADRTTIGMRRVVSNNFNII